MGAPATLQALGAAGLGLTTASALTGVISSEFERSRLRAEPLRGGAAEETDERHDNS